jgi:hypothetical protein
VLDLFDPGGLCGGLSISQIHQLQHAVLLEPVDYVQVEESLYTLLPYKDVTSPHFPDQLFCPASRLLDVMMDLERRRRLTSQVWWDFCSLDSDGDFGLSLSEALLLFKLTFGASFSEELWQDFVFARQKSNFGSKICFEEIRPWLCGTKMSGAQWSDEEAFNAMQKLKDAEVKEDVEEFWKLRDMSQGKKNKSRHLDDDYEANKRESKKRKLNKGADVGGITLPGAAVNPASSDVTSLVLLTLLEGKYKILIEMLGSSCVSGDGSRKGEASKYAAAISKTVFEDEGTDISILDNFKLDFTLLQTMGEETSSHTKRENELLLKGTEYIADGWR